MSKKLSDNSILLRISKLAEGSKSPFEIQMGEKKASTPAHIYKKW